MLQNTLGIIRNLIVILCKQGNCYVSLENMYWSTNWTINRYLFCNKNYRPHFKKLSKTH